MFSKKPKSRTGQQPENREPVAGLIHGGIPENTIPSNTRDKILHQKTTYEVFYLGMIQDVNIGNSRKRDTEAQLIDQVEEAQIEGKLPTMVGEEARVILHMSKHGIEVMDITGQEVLQRHPLHTIGQVIQYEDGFGKPNIALKIGQLQATRSIFQCYVFQSVSEEQAQAICYSVRKIFDTITGKT